MLKKVLLGVSLAVVAGGILVPAFAAAPVKMSKVAPVADFVAEAEAKVKTLETALATNDSYLAGQKKSIPEDAGILAVLAQAIAEHEEKPTWKASAADLREGAKAIANSKTYDEAKKGLASVKDALGGKSAGASKDHEWGKLAKLGGVMAEVNKRNGALRKAVRSTTADTAQASRDASVVALLAVVTHEDTHEVKSPADLPKWKAFALDMQTNMSAMAGDFRKKDVAAAKESFTKAGKSCADCHAEIRDK